ncbi:hypothetical protein Tco_1250532 [Tanacetum coccineum]
MAKCHHLSGDTWHDNSFGTVSGATARATGQRWSTTVTSGGQRWLTTVNGGGPPPDRRSTTGQRWLTASQRSGQQLETGRVAT